MLLIKLLHKLTASNNYIIECQKLNNFKLFLIEGQKGHWLLKIIKAKTTRAGVKS